MAAVPYLDCQSHHVGITPADIHGDPGIDIAVESLRAEHAPPSGVDLLRCALGFESWPGLCPTRRVIQHEIPGPEVEAGRRLPDWFAEMDHTFYGICLDDMIVGQPGKPTGPVGMYFQRGAGDLIADRWLGYLRRMCRRWLDSRRLDVRLRQKRTTARDHQYDQIQRPQYGSSWPLPAAAAGRI